MSPIRADEIELPDDEPVVPQPRSRARTSAVAAPPLADNPVLEVSLPEETLRVGMPIIRARVVYLGPGEHHAVSLPGQIHEEFFEDPDGPIERTTRRGELKRYRVLKQAVETGLSQYDFTCRDQRGDMIPSRLMPSVPGVPEKFRGRPFVWCEHVAHLRTFFLATDQPEGRGNKLYHVMVRSEHMPILSQHLKVSERNRRQQDQLYADVAGR